MSGKSFGNGDSSLREIAADPGPFRTDRLVRTRR